MARKRLLQENPDPIRMVPAAVRDVWTKVPRTYICDDCGSTRARLVEVEVERTVRGHHLNLKVYRCVDSAGCKRRQK